MKQYIKDFNQFIKESKNSKKKVDSKEYDTYYKAVDKMTQKRVGLPADEIGDETIKTAFQDGDTVKQLVDWYIEKYDLTEKE